MDSKKEQVEIIIHLSPEQVDFLDIMAAEERISRTKLVQSILNDQLEFYMTIKLLSNNQSWSKTKMGKRNGKAIKLNKPDY